MAGYAGDPRRALGCGKTTLLRMAAGLEDITEGQIAIGGEVVNDLSPKQRDIAMIFQNYALYPHMTVYDEWHSVCSCGARRRPRSTDGFGRREESLLHYRVAARAVLSEDVEETIADEAVDAAPVGDDLAARFVARVDAPLSCRHRRHDKFYLDTKELHFFDPETHLAIDDARVVSRKRVLLSP